MRRAAFLLAILLLMSGPASAQIGKDAIIAAGSPEDHALKAINDTDDPAEKIALLDKFVADYGKGDMVLAAYEIYISVYTAQKNYDKVFEYGDKTFAVDPDSFNTAFKLFQVALGKKDPEKMCTYGERMEDILARFKASPAPTGMDANEWIQRKAEALKEVKDNLEYMQYTMIQTASQVANPVRRSALLERYAIGFVDSPYASKAQSALATAYKQAKNFARMQEFVQKILERDPGNISMLLFLADDGAERGVNLDKSEEAAHRAIDLLGKAAKPEGLSDDQWARQKSLQQGLAWSSIGQVQIQRKQDALAVGTLKTAAPMLKSDNFSYARNQYRLGFAYLNLKRNADASAAFAEAASVDSVYRVPAEEKLGSIPTTAAPAKRPAKKRP